MGQPGGERHGLQQRGSKPRRCRWHATQKHTRAVPWRVGREVSVFLYDLRRLCRCRRRRLLAGVLLARLLRIRWRPGLQILCRLPRLPSPAERCWSRSASRRACKPPLGRACRRCTLGTVLCCYRLHVARLAGVRESGRRGSGRCKCALQGWPFVFQQTARSQSHAVAPIDRQAPPGGRRKECG